MSPIRIDASSLSPDTRAFFAALAAGRARYVVVGGEAVILHGNVHDPRDTSDTLTPEIMEDMAKLMFVGLTGLTDDRGVGR